MISVVTIAREYGSGGAELGRLVALKLGWELLDRQLVDRVANIAGLDPEAAARLDEQASRWWRWVVAAGASIASPYPFALSMWSGETDEDSVHVSTTQLIQAAADSGGCVIVGRGAQCFLQGQPDVFNVLAYAPLEERIRRLRARQPESADIHPLSRRWTTGARNMSNTTTVGIGATKLFTTYVSTLRLVSKLPLNSLPPQSDLRRNEASYVHANFDSVKITCVVS